MYEDILGSPTSISENEKEKKIKWVQHSIATSKKVIKEILFLKIT